MLKALRYVILVVAANCFFISIAQEPSPLSPTISHDSDAYYAAGQQKMSIDEVIEKYRQGKFKRFRSSVLNVGIAKQYYWIYFAVRNNSDVAETVIIELANSRLNHIALYEANASGVVYKGTLGDFNVFNQRTIKHKNFVYPVTIYPHRKNAYFLFVDQVGHTFSAPVKVHAATRYREIILQNYFLDGLVYGILVFVALLSLLFYISTSQHLYLYYSLYIFTAILWFFSYFDLGYQYLWGTLPQWNTASSLFASSANLALNLQICQILLKLNKANRKLSTVMNYLKPLLPITGLFPVFINLNVQTYAVNNAYLTFFLLCVLASMTIVFFAVTFYSFNGSDRAAFYMASSFFKAGSIIYLALIELGLMYSFYYMEDFLQLGIIVETVLLTYALGRRYTLFRLKTFEHIIMAHENERDALSKEIHDNISGSLSGISIALKNVAVAISDKDGRTALGMRGILEELERVQVEARSISHNTMPDYIRDQSIGVAIERYLNIIQSGSNSTSTTTPQIHFSFNAQKSSISEAVKLNIFRIVQELISNLLRHSKATSAELILSFQRRELSIICEDNGIGLQVEGESYYQGAGLKNIASRVELMQGHFSIKSPTHKLHFEHNGNSLSLNSSGGSGTLVSIRIPYWHNLLQDTGTYDY